MAILTLFLVESKYSGFPLHRTDSKENILFEATKTHTIAYTCHYENTPMQYTTIFHGCKNDNFQMTKVDNFIFALNIDCGYTLEPPR